MADGASGKEEEEEDHDAEDGGRSQGGMSAAHSAFPAGNVGEHFVCAVSSRLLLSTGSILPNSSSSTLAPGGSLSNLCKRLRMDRLGSSFMRVQDLEKTG